MRACVVQELRRKKQQLQVCTSEVADTQALVRVQDAIKRLNEELGDMGIQLGLLQHQLANAPAPQLPTAMLAA